MAPPQASKLRLPAIATATPEVLAIVFAATLIRSTLGFGEALVAVPLLAIFIPLQVAAPLAALLSVTVAGLVLAQDWDQVHLPSAAWLLGTTALGLPLGLLLLKCGHPRGVEGALAGFILTFSLYSLAVRAPPELKRDHVGWLSLCGFCAGVLGGAYGMNGPPLALYGAMRRWPARRFRATLQGYFFPASALVLLGYRATGVWTPEVTRTYLWALPVALPAVLIGRLLNRRMRVEAFVRWVYVGLVAVGALLLCQALGLSLS